MIGGGFELIVEPVVSCHLITENFPPALGTTLAGGRWNLNLDHGGHKSQPPQRQTGLK